MFEQIISFCWPLTFCSTCNMYVHISRYDYRRKHWSQDEGLSTYTEYRALSNCSSPLSDNCKGLQRLSCVPLFLSLKRGEGRERLGIQ